MLTTIQRENQDDGYLTALLIGPLAGSCLLYISSKQAASTSSPVPPHWRIEPPDTLPPPSLSPTLSLLLSRRNLVELTILCSFILVAHFCASAARESSTPEEKDGGWVPKKESRRFGLYFVFASLVTGFFAMLKACLGVWGSGLGQGSWSVTKVSYTVG
jgi:dolichol kinase